MYIGFIFNRQQAKIPNDKIIVSSDSR